MLLADLSKYFQFWQFDSNVPLGSNVYQKYEIECALFN